MNEAFLTKEQLIFLILFSWYIPVTWVAGTFVGAGLAVTVFLFGLVLAFGVAVAKGKIK